MLFPESHAWTPAQRWLIAGAVVAGIAALVALVYSSERGHRGKPAQAVEHVEDLGFGFRGVTIAKLNKLELGHYPFLYRG